MNQTEKLLKCVSENARTGREATTQLLDRTEDAKMRDELDYQRALFTTAEKNAETKLNQTGEKSEPEGIMQKMGMWAGIRMNTMMDKSSAHIADIMIQGYTMGITETTKAQNECPNADAEAKGISASFITQQQDAIERMKQFLI